MVHRNDTGPEQDFYLSVYDANDTMKMLMLKELTLSNNTEQLTKAQQRILGFLVAANGNERSGSTVREIQEGTGLSHNSVYVALRETNNKQGERVIPIPGVLKCNWHTNTGATQYYVHHELMSEQFKQYGMLNTATATIKVSAQQTIFDSKEWAEVPEKIFGGLSKIVDEGPSPELIQTLFKEMTVLRSDEVDDYWYKIAVGGQAIAILALKLAQQPKE